jgi:hypothetical protein
MTIRGAMKDAAPRLGIMVVRDAAGRPVSFRSRANLPAEGVARVSVIPRL